MKDLSILIVHYNTPRLLRQTLRGIRSSAPRLAYETIVVDNNAKARVDGMIRREFPEVRVVVSEKNLGFGGGMNVAMKEASGRYLVVFNPDIALFPGALEEFVRFMDEKKDVGIMGPKLLNPDRSLQYSCYRFMRPATIAYRRLPFIRNSALAQKEMERYMMLDWDHNQTRDVDYMLGACLVIRREAYEKVGGFDPAFFMYFEDQDLCRRFWKAGWRVVYHPGASMVHYHRRETAEGSFLQQLKNPLTRIQMQSARIYFAKYRGEGNPREAWEKQKTGGIIDG